MLELVPGAGECARDRVLRMPHHPREELRRGGERADRGGHARDAADWLRRAGGEGAAFAAGPSRDDPRRSLTATPLATIDPSTIGRSKGSRASGRARRIRGSRRNASSSLAGPRRSGLVTSAARRRFRPEATFSSPSSVRTATAQAVGPCTSTPFWSAIPPSRIFSSASAIARRAYPATPGCRRRHTFVAAATPTRDAFLATLAVGRRPGSPARDTALRAGRCVPPRTGETARRAPGRRPECARPPSGSAGRPGPRSSPSAGRSRRRRCRRSRGASASR